MFFYDLYIVKPGDNLTNIGKQFGFLNPGPIVVFPPNANQFRNKSPDLIYSKDKLLIPWHRNLLRNYITSCKQQINEVSNKAGKLINKQMKRKKEFDQFLTLIDGLNFLANVGVSTTLLIRQGCKGVISSKAVSIWLLDHSTSNISSITTLAIPTPAAPKKDFKFYVRHTLGPWNPSFWASVIIAYQENDWDIYLYGSDAIAHKRILKIKKQAETDIYNLKKIIADAEKQNAKKFYNHRL